MKKILIATRNKDKFKIVSKLLKTNTFKDFEFYSLNDINEQIIDKKEVGDIKNRSMQKALNAYNSVNEKYDYIVGIDDGIKMKGKMIENVKDYINDVVNGEYLSEQEKVFITRAYTFINNTGISKTFITEIPFEYVKPKEKIDIKTNSYPFSYVFSAINLGKPIIDLSEEEANSYYLKHSQDKFEEVESFFNDNH